MNDEVQNSGAEQSRLIDHVANLESAREQLIYAAEQLERQASELEQQADDIMEEIGRSERRLTELRTAAAEAYEHRNG